MKSAIILIIFSLCLESKANTQRESVIIQTARCAQDIADYGYGGLAGLPVALRVLDNMKKTVELESNLKLCLDFITTKSKVSPNREKQLDLLKKFKTRTAPATYYFLRGAIRPLIKCTLSDTLTQFYRTCHSTTGKNWYEVALYDSDSHKNKTSVFRLGHGSLVAGISAKGPQDYFNQEDAEYIQALPADFTETASIDLPAELKADYLKVKVYMLPRMTTFMEYFFK